MTHPLKPVQTKIKVVPAWELTLEQYKACPLEQLFSGAAPFIELTSEVKELAKSDYIKRTNDPWGADENSGEFCLDEYFFSVKTGKITGQDYLGHKEEVELALAEGRYVPAAVFEEYTEMNRNHDNLLTDNMPPWAIGKATGYMQVGAQLATRDGRRVGNAVVIDLVQKYDRELAKILTDAGSVLHLTSEEMVGFFHTPIWLMDTAKHPAMIRKDKEIAKVICCNDSIEAVTLKGETEANELMEEMKNVHKAQNHNFPEYQFYWHIEEVKLR